MTAAATILATLGHPGRLAVFRLLMRHMPQGARPGAVAQALGIKPNTLSQYLSALEQAGLVLAERHGRAIQYRVSLPNTRDLLEFLSDDCCRGRPDLCDTPTAAMTTPPFNVLFLCSGNSARSIFAEALLTDLGAWRFRAFSAGTRPATHPHPMALAILARAGLPTDGLRSKPIAEYTGPDAPKMDFVFTVCDSAADEDCAPLPGQPLTAHWGLPDPVKVQGTDAEKALTFAETFAALRRRIAAFTALPLTSLNKISVQEQIDTLSNAPE